MALAALVGVLLFYVQHQFDPAHWRRDEDWDYYTAAIEGSSFLDLPWPLRWFTANIGYHHIHHLDSRIPYYALPKSAGSAPRPETRQTHYAVVWPAVHQPETVG